jgi:ferredoxin
VIDPQKCICCGMCAVKCPRGVIRDLHGVMTD